MTIITPVQTQKEQKRKLKEIQMKEFLKAEIEEMLKYKYIESEKACCDIGDNALIDWICKYAIKFREEWEKIHGKVDNEGDSY